MTTDFLTWLENDGPMIQRQNANPASADVIRTGEQPQLRSDGGFNPVKEKEDQDKVMALDSHVQRIKEVVNTFQPQSKQGQDAKNLAVDFCKQWTEILSKSHNNAGEQGLGSVSPSAAEIEYRKNNQPLPEPGRSLRAPPPAF